jgi:hypothetical protein
MKKQILTLMIASISLIGYSQVGVGTVDPETTLDVVGTNTTVVDGATDIAGILTSADGITVPSVTDASTTTINGVNDGQLVYDTTQKAFYYFNSATTTWTAVGGGGGASPYQDIIGDVTTVTAPTYTVAATDYAVITEHSAAVTITFPVLTAADAGRTLFLFNNNTGYFNNVLAGAPVTGQPTLTKNRAMEFLWSGSGWFIIGK